MEAGALSTSHTDQLNVNPAYPAELQPRDRTRSVSADQVQALVTHLVPEKLGENPLAQHGAPIVGPDGVVESGNARAIALRRAYAEGTPSGTAYRTWLRQHAGEFGLSAADLTGMRAPVLVRVRTTEMSPDERAAFARTANTRTTAAKSGVEQARADARRVAGLMDRYAPGEGGNLLAASNRDFVRAFVSSLPTAERGALLTADGRLSAGGVRRLQQAVFAHVYGDGGALARAAESTDDPTRNVTAALLRAAGPVGELSRRASGGAAGDYALAADAAAAADRLARLRASGTSVEDYLAQQSFLGEELTPFQRQLLTTFHEFRRSGRKIAALLNRYVETALAAEDPSSGALFGGFEPPAREALLERAAQWVREGEPAEGPLSAGEGKTQAHAAGPAPYDHTCTYSERLGNGVSVKTKAALWRAVQEQPALTAFLEAHAPAFKQVFDDLLSHVLTPEQEARTADTGLVVLGDERGLIGGLHRGQQDAAARHEFHVSPFTTGSATMRGRTGTSR